MSDSPEDSMDTEGSPNLTSHLSGASVEELLALDVFEDDDDDLASDNDTSLLLSLPEEVFLHILSFLDAPDLVAMAQVCRLTHTLSADPFHWHHLVLRDWVRRWHTPLPKAYKQDADLASNAHAIDWREHYVERTRIHQRWNDGDVTRKFRLPASTNGPLFNVKFMEDDLLVCSGQATEVTVVNWRKEEVEARIDVHSQGSLGMGYDPLNKRVLYGDFAGHVQLVDLRLDTPKRDVLQSMRIRELKDLLGDAGVRYDDCLEKSDLVNRAAARLPRYKPKATLYGHQGVVVSLQLDAQGDNNRLATCSFDHTLRLWDIERKECLSVLEGHVGPVDDCRLFGDRLISSGHDVHIRLWDLNRNEQLHAWSFQQSWIWNCDWDNQNTVVSAACDGTAVQIDLRQGTDQSPTYLGYASAEISGLHVDFDNGPILISSFDGSVRQYDLRKPGDLVWKSLVTASRCTRLDKNADAVAVGSFDGKLAVLRFDDVQQQTNKQ